MFQDDFDDVEIPKGKNNMMKCKVCDEIREKMQREKIPLLRDKLQTAMDGHKNEQYEQRVHWWSKGLQADQNPGIVFICRGFPCMNLHVLLLLLLLLL